MPIDILFLCGTLEPSQCGVADYIHALAKTLAAKGDKCACLAIHDPYIRPTASSLIHRSTKHNVDIVRIPEECPWSLKVKLIMAQLESLRPEYISLHYVPYAYNKHGLPFALLTSLLSLRYRAKWEITAHELWVDPTVSLRYRLLSRLQRLIFKQLYAKLDPVVVHVTNSSYQSQLAKYFMKSSILPLFSNIPLRPLPSTTDRAESQWTFVVFGTINRDWHPDRLLEQIEAARYVHGIESCHFISIGKVGGYGAALWDSLEALPYPAFEFSRLGPLSAERVSEQLQLADFGICVAPSILIEKSGSVAAMLAHGLPVIINRLSTGCDPWHQKLRSSGKYILLDDSFVKCLGVARHYAPESQLEDTANLFIRSLRIAS